MSFHISRADGAGIEKHERRQAAEKAFWILTAHEVKNGRPVDYYVLTERKGGEWTVIPVADITPPSGLDLPSWACDALAAAKLM